MLPFLLEMTLVNKYIVCNVLISTNRRTHCRPYYSVRNGTTVFVKKFLHTKAGEDNVIRQSMQAVSFVL